MPFFIAFSPVHNRFQTCTSRPHAVGKVYTRDPPIFSIRVLHFQMKHVAVLGTSTEASFLFFFSAHVTDTVWLCNDFANHDQKSLFATFQSHSSILSIKSVNELQCHSVHVHANCASLFFLRRLHATCICQRAAARPKWVFLTAGGTYGHPLQSGRCTKSLRLTMVRAMCFHTLVPNFFCRLSNSLCDHSMRATENWKAPIPFCAKSSAKSSGVSEWHLIMSRATLAFSRTSSLMGLISPFPHWPRYKYRHASLISSALRRSPFILRSGAGMLSFRFRSLSITSMKVFLIDWYCFYYFVRNSLVALLAALYARILFLRFVIISFSFIFVPPFFSPLFFFPLFFCVQGVCLCMCM